MSIIGIQTNRTNPPFTKADLSFWMPQYSKFLLTDEGQTMFDNLYEIANNKIFKSIFGSDWKYAMSLCISHYMNLISSQTQAPAGDTLTGIAGGQTRGVLSSMSVGAFSKSYDIDKTLSNDADALFWNQTQSGAILWALLKTKSLASIMVVTSNPVPGAN